MTNAPEAAVDGSARILIVDDEPLNVDYLEQELESAGYVTETAANGIEALERVAAAPPDLVLLDVMMPDMDGISALRILKADPETRLIPVVLMTALNAVEDRVRGIEAGADDFLSKPVDDRELMARIRTALALKRTIDDAVGELRSAATHLEEYGRRERDVAILALHWRLQDTSLPEEAVCFVVRRRRGAAERQIRELGGLPSEGEGNPLVAVFDGDDERARVLAALEAAQSLSDQAGTVDGAHVETSVAISVGRAQVGSARVRREGRPAWAFGATGEPVDQASDLARRAPSAAVLLAHDAAAAVSERFALEAVEGGFLLVGSAGDSAVGEAPVDRRIRTILVTDIVDSTPAVERMGDRASGEVLAEHDRLTRSQLARFGGEELDTAGDGFIATFDSAARAISCALALAECLAPLGVTIRAGLHTGEVELVDGRVRGIAIHVASRIGAAAGPGEVLVSGTTRELAAGAELVFADKGEHALKGVSEPRRLYAVAALRRRGDDRPVAGRSSRRYPARLTAREVDVLRLVAVGLSDAEVAERLVVSVRTVNAHLRSVYRKAGVRSRTAAARFAEEHGLL